jgi:23S rRNA-/tRNA-specific pseudouridylate synthase
MLDSPIKTQRPLKHQPGGMTIVYEDPDIIVIDKMAGLLTLGTETEKERTAYFLLNA